MPHPTVVSCSQSRHPDLVTLKWSDGSVGRYLVRGGIAWPRVTLKGGVERLTGHVVVACVNAETDRMRVLDHAEFNVIEEPDTEGASLSLVPFLMRAYATSMCSRYYWHDHVDTWNQFRGQIRRCEYLIPQPRLIEVQWDDDGVARQALLRAGAEKRMSMPTSIHELISVADQSHENAYNPARLAMWALVMGIQRRPVAPREVESGEFLDAIMGNRF